MCVRRWGDDRTTQNMILGSVINPTDLLHRIFCVAFATCHVYRGSVCLYVGSLCVHLSVSRLNNAYVVEGEQIKYHKTEDVLPGLPATHSYCVSSSVTHTHTTLSLPRPARKQTQANRAKNGRIVRGQERKMAGSGKLTQLRTKT